MSRATELADKRSKWTSADCMDAAAELRRLDCVNAELEMALTVYVTAIATAGGGDKQLFMAALRQADDKARAALTSSTGEPS